MTEFGFDTEKMDDPEVVSELEMDDYEKYRLKQGDITVDLAIVDLSSREADEYVEQRKEEISSSETEVPHPYKPEKQSREEDRQLVEFSGREGEGFADPEFNLASGEGGRIRRYRYRVFWKEFPRGKLCEVEFYLPVDRDTDVDEIVKSLSLE